MFLYGKKNLLVAFLFVVSISLAACSSESEKVEADVDNSGGSSVDESYSYAKYVGEYQDSYSQRAWMKVEDLGDGLGINVYWSSSAVEVSSWSMTAKFTEPNKLSYTDCEYGIMILDDDGDESYTMEYESGEGYFTIADGKFHWDGAEDESCRDCVFESISVEFPENKEEVSYIEESVDLNNLEDGTYPVRLFFDKMKRNEDSLSLDFMIYTVVHYAPEDINSLKRGDILYEYVDETTTNNYVIDTANFPIDEVCVVNGGYEGGAGITLTLDDSGLYRLSVDEGYTRNSSHGIVTMEIPDSVTFEDNYNLEEAKLKADELYNYFKGLNDTEKSYFNENNTFITVSDGKIVGINRIYLP